MTTERSALVLATGPLALFQDLGRPGLAHLGVPRSGAADRGALATVNQLLGNDPAAAAIECLFGGFSLRAEATLELLLAGAPAPGTVDGAPVERLARFELRTGETLELGMAPVGARVYIGARGGFEAPRSLGSRSTCTLTGLGPAPIRPGGRIAVAEPAPQAPPWDFLSLGPRPGGGPAVLRGRLGPRADRVAGLDLAAQTWVAQEQSDRVGVRLRSSGAGPRWRFEPQRSEPVAHGSVQATPSGELICFLADHPTTGGYPVVGVLDEPAVGLVAQLRPGEHARFALS
ncbi:Allophanate hydrolase subunit 2 [Segniliparus rotundus DSM 44985]|uniref:Allophanate hydrolase subunit 2 n=1 Tax=Segniliparus rotundus (strain ATCC BAA-972 / CDC 1076 / CIP 108378 / DSM 44985 / JCM 13578) TaxID=640132 RepID=D6ZAD0_SEGRD|nr:biotin-dependent carboxyltransferase family protein [Segniliparus rotundus]ADG96672.1 Allophanate hydrolase subunit 2 [Segniliparus rotundus DSM 44985]